MTRPLATIRSSIQRKAAAFTLIELMVVIGIIVLMATILVYGTRAMTEGNSLAQANNMLAAYLSEARATAMASGQPTGVAVYDQTAANASPVNTAATAIVLVQQTDFIAYANATGPADIRGYLPRFMFIRVLPGASPTYLPTGITATTIGDQEIFTGSGGTVRARVVMFDSKGRLMLRGGLCTEQPTAVIPPAGDPVREAYDWHMLMVQWSPGSPPTVTNPSTLAPPAPYTADTFAETAPGFVLFNTTDYQDAANAGFPGAGNAATWLQQNGKIVTVNAYTGSLQ